MELTSNPKVTIGDINTSKRNFQYSSAKAMRELHYKATPIESVVDEMIMSFYEDGRLSRKGKRIVENELFSNID